MHIQNRPYKKGTPRGDAFDRGVAFVETKIKANPAPAAYAELQAAYDYFNRELFGQAPRRDAFPASPPQELRLLG